MKFAQIELPINVNLIINGDMKSKLFYICCIGIGFSYRGDEVIILWPWKWKFRTWKIYWLLSVEFESGFYSFNEMNREWRDYFRACEMLLRKER